MKIAYFIKKTELAGDPQIKGLLERLALSGAEVYNIQAELREGTDMLLSFGGDGTFLTAAHLVCEAGVPVLGVNLGRMGFLSDSDMGEVERCLLGGEYHIECREMLEVEVHAPGFEPFSSYAINEVALRRSGSGMLGIDVVVDHAELPTYWADGLLISTSSGSTAYSLSVGGPICTPDVDAFIIAPIAPHNLNVRPLLVPRKARISLSARERKHESVTLSLDNMEYQVPSDARVSVRCAPFPLRRVVLGKSNFIDALRSKLFWGEDVRNNK